MIELLYSNASILPVIGGISAAIFAISLLSLPWLAAKIPEDYFLHHRRKPSQWLSTFHPVFRVFIILIKNLLGLILLAGGVSLYIYFRKRKSAATETLLSEAEKEKLAELWKGKRS